MDPTALGRYLRETREARERSLEDAVRALRIRRNILEAFESGDFDVADSAVRVRGMLRNYARYLGLEEDRVLEYYEAARSDNKRRRRFGRKRSEPELSAPRRITDTPPSLPAVPEQQQRTVNVGGVLRNLAMLLVSVASLAVIAFVIYDTLNLGQQASTPAAAISTPLAGDLTATSTNTATITPRPTSTPDPANGLALGIVGLRVELELLQRSWVRVVVDGTENFAGILEPGATREWDASSEIVLVAANAAGIDVTFNGVPQPRTGARGQQIEWIFSTSGVDVSLGADRVPLTDTPAPPTNTPAPSPTTTHTPTQIAAGNPAAADSAAAVASPTPLFGALSTPALEPASSTPLDQQAAAAAPVTATALPVSEGTATPAPSPTSAAILPPRQTPANPTPTKTG